MFLELLLSYYLLAILSSVCSALLDTSLGLEWVYLSVLDSVFAWSLKWCQVLEEEEPTTANEISEMIDDRLKKKNKKSLPSSASKSAGLIDKKDRIELHESDHGSDEPTPSSDPDFNVFRPLNDDLLRYTKAGFEAIVDDEYTASFSVEEIPYWNLLARNEQLFRKVNWRLRLVWLLGFLVRYVFLAPVRIAILFVAMLFLTVMTFALGYVHEENRRRSIGLWLSKASFRLFARTVSLAATFHDVENAKTEGGGICVANHTSPIDAIVLNTRVAYCLTGQKHRGWLGYAAARHQKIVPHLWFERSSSSDRENVKTELEAHAGNPRNPPTLIFPEGVCVNNTAVVMFKKGAFEATSTIFPIAIRYSAKFGDAFWSCGGWTEHIWAMLTSWAIVVDVYYLPPMDRLVDESPAKFADRVKAAIAGKIGLRFINWDGRLNLYTSVKPQMLEDQRRLAARNIRHLSGNSKRSTPPSMSPLSNPDPTV